MATPAGDEEKEDHQKADGRAHADEPHPGRQAAQPERWQCDDQDAAQGGGGGGEEVRVQARLGPRAVAPDDWHPPLRAARRAGSGDAVRRLHARDFRPAERAHVRGEPRAVSDPSVQSELTAALERWELATDGPVVDTPSGCVAFVKRGADRRVLKIIGADSDEMAGVAAYAHYDGRGAVRLLAHVGRALLLERIEPGDALTRRVIEGDDDGATKILGDLMASLHRAGPAKERSRQSRRGAKALPTIGASAARFRSIS